MWYMSRRSFVTVLVKWEILYWVYVDKKFHISKCARNICTYETGCLFVSISICCWINGRRLRIRICFAASVGAALESGFFKSLLTVFFCLCSSTSLIYWYVLLFLDRRKSKARRSKSRYKMLEADEQDTLELQPPRAGKNTQPSKLALPSTHINGFQLYHLMSTVWEQVKL